MTIKKPTPITYVPFFLRAATFLEHIMVDLESEQLGYTAQIMALACASCPKLQCLELCRTLPGLLPSVCMIAQLQKLVLKRYTMPESDVSDIVAISNLQKLKVTTSLPSSVQSYRLPTLLSMEQFALQSKGDRGKKDFLKAVFVSL